MNLQFFVDLKALISRRQKVEDRNLRYLALPFQGMKLDGTTSQSKDLIPLQYVTAKCSI